MRSVPKLIRRFVGILLLSMLLLFTINIAAIVVIGRNQVSNASPYTMARETGTALKKMEIDNTISNKEGADLEKTRFAYILPEEAAAELQAWNAWAILIANDTHEVIWHTDNLPLEIPLSYTLSDISNLTLGYICDYPTYAAEAVDGLIVLGFPKDSFWKHMWPSWDYELIAHLPATALKVICINFILIFLIYIIANTKLLKSVEPITKAIQALPTKAPVHVKETGVLSELAVNINRTSDILQAQQSQLRKKELARANWIAGVSHDIRTPLSVVMGHAGRLAEDKTLPQDAQNTANVIVKQSARMKNLINDLNLASKLEYNMQPLSSKSENVVALVRQVVADFINMDLDASYPIEWNAEDNAKNCLVMADKDLLKRAVTNLIQNCMNHNENGCTIRASVSVNMNPSRDTNRSANLNIDADRNASPGTDADKNTNLDITRKHLRHPRKWCVICVEDDGIGVGDTELEALNHSPHYMLCDTNTTEQRHGLGLLIVKQIASAHGGTVDVAHSGMGGLAVRIRLPVVEE